MSKISTSCVTLKGNLGHYFAYWRDGLCHFRIHGSVDGDDTWTTFPCDEREWLLRACLVICTWENSVDCQFQAIYEDREACHEIAQTGEEKRKRANFYSEWFEEGLWHVASLHPRALA